MSRTIEFNYLCKHTYQGIVNFYSKTFNLDEIEKSIDIVEDIGNSIDISCNCINESCNYCECNTIFDYGDFEVIAKRQFTGLLDCNGVKIFDGDIVEVSYDNEDPSVHVVKWYGNEYPAFELSPELGCDCNGFSHIYNCGDTTITVIGNIHQNSELLK